jgi:23S rRNA (adenine1618-N6)-methyltransferase
VQPHPLAGDTIDFADPAAVLTLNRALLKLHYGVAHWDIPAGSLCPPIPSRADYLHHLADLLATDAGGIPQAPSVVGLDIGTGANCIYPLIGTHVYGWNFVGTDIDPVSVNWAQTLVAADPSLQGRIECRLQPAPDAIFKGVVAPGEEFAFSLCNPPFHASPAEAAAGTLRKLKNLGGQKPAKTVLNFGGRSNELWCPGGEAAFVRRMIIESAARPELCVWFTTLVSKRGSLPGIYRDLEKARVADVRTLTMFAGQKQSRIVAWTFLPGARRRQRLTLTAGLRS